MTMTIFRTLKRTWVPNTATLLQALTAPNTATLPRMSMPKLTLLSMSAFFKTLSTPKTRMFLSSTLAMGFLSRTMYSSTCLPPTTHFKSLQSTPWITTIQ